MTRRPVLFDLGPVHFVGIGGIGMSGIAEIMLRLCYTVQGSDARADRPRSALLRDRFAWDAGFPRNGVVSLRSR
jgi:UDP-N-acetylmuramate-alanine ligase